MGWRARIGGLWPADGVRDAELWQFLPKGVSLHLTRTGAPQSEMTVKNVRAEGESPELIAAARLLATIRLDCIAYLCTSASFVGGPGFDQQIVRGLEEATGLPATTTSTAMLRALHALDVHRIAAVAPYPEPVTERLVDFLAGESVEVVRWASMGLGLGTQIGEVTPAELYRLVRETDHPDAEAVFISCTNLPTVEIIEALEQDLGKPVLSANQVTLWHSLILAGVRAPMAGLGKLYTCF